DGGVEQAAAKDWLTVEISTLSANCYRAPLVLTRQLLIENLRHQGETLFGFGQLEVIPEGVRQVTSRVGGIPLRSANSGDNAGSLGPVAPGEGSSGARLGASACNAP